MCAFPCQDPRGGYRIGRQKQLAGFFFDDTDGPGLFQICDEFMIFLPIVGFTFIVSGRHEGQISSSALTELAPRYHVVIGKLPFPINRISNLEKWETGFPFLFAGLAAANFLGGLFEELTLKKFMSVYKSQNSKQRVNKWYSAGSMAHGGPLASNRALPLLSTWSATPAGIKCFGPTTLGQN